MVLGLRYARRARDLTLLAGVERAAPTFIVRIFMHYELGESGNMREAPGRWDLSLTPWGKAAEFHEICQIWNNHVTSLMKLSQMGSKLDRATGNRMCPSQAQE
jgi:hypothetical protein